MGALMPLESVSWTAVVVAAARAIETHHRDSLVADEYAEHFVQSVQGSTTLPTRIEQVRDGDDDPLWGRGGRYFGLRTRVFDDYLRAAASAGIRQFVILGSGLDTRAYRLEWPDGSVVFELDQEHVHEFKSEVLASLGARPRSLLHRVDVDLREDWYPALCGAGFDPLRATAWLAEGLLIYLSAHVEGQLMGHIDNGSTPGSRLAYETFDDAAAVRRDPNLEETEVKMGMDFVGLVDPGIRPDSVGQLRQAGWHMADRSNFEFLAEYGRGPEPGVEDIWAHTRWVFGTKPS